MNFESLHEYISNYKTLVISSGFKRDVEDYNGSMASLQNNGHGLRDVCNKVIQTLERIHESDLREELQVLFSGSSVKPFAENDFLKQLKGIRDDSEMKMDRFFAELQQVLQKLEQEMRKTDAEVNRIDDFIKPYLTKREAALAEGHEAYVSIIYKDKESTKSLKGFTKSLNSWNKYLPVLERLLTEGAPEDVEIVEVHNGSIDLIVNLDLDVALDLTAVFKVCFMSFASYLAYKKTILPYVQASSNPEIQQLDRRREELMLDDIGAQTEAALKDRHEARKSDGGVELTGGQADAAIRQIAELITSHVVKGNDFKLLTEVATSEDVKQEDQGLPVKEALASESSKARRALESVPEEDLKLLKEKYSGPGEGEADKQTGTQG